MINAADILIRELEGMKTDIVKAIDKANDSLKTAIDKANDSLKKMTMSTDCS